MAWSKQEKADWDELYEYVRKEIMGYDKDMKLSKNVVLRLQGLSKGQFMRNTKAKPMANYEFKDILYTFKVCKPKILNWFKVNDIKFKDESHKFNSAMVFIENEINDVVIRLKKANKSKEKTESLDVSYMNSEIAEYRKASVDVHNSDLEGLW